MDSKFSLDEKIARKIDELDRTLSPLPATVVLPASSRALAQFIDHTLLKPETTSVQIRQLCLEAMQYGFYSVCVHPSWVPLCLDLLNQTSVKVCSVIGFPQGMTLPAVKAFETAEVLQLGAHEVDMVINVGRLKDGDYRLVHEDIALVVDAAAAGGALLKVIIETGLLTHAEKIAACVICQEAGANFVKTSTGFNGGGATVEDIALMRRVVGTDMGVKASGGIRSAEDALAMIRVGATRIGASASVRIMQEMAGLAMAKASVESY